MKTIYLKTDNTWQKFEYENISDIEKDLSKRNITISDNSYVNSSYIGDGSTVDGSMVDGSMVLNGSTVNGSRVNDSRVDGSRVLNGSTVDGSTVLNGSTVDGSRVLNGSTVLNGNISKYTAMFGINLYLYTVSAYLNKEGIEIIQLGCYTRTRTEWENDFWNNLKEFPNDNSEKSNARVRAFEVACFFLDKIKNK
jgi:hypothetical protein